MSELQTVGNGWLVFVWWPVFTTVPTKPPPLNKFPTPNTKLLLQPSSLHSSLTFHFHTNPSKHHTYTCSSTEMVGPQRPQFVLFGSSIVQLSFSNDGWGSILADIYARKVDIVLRGYYGWNSRRAVQVLDQVFPKDAATQPSLVIVYFGGNDSMGSHSSGLGPHVPLPEYIENMRKIALHLKSLSDTTRVIFLSCPPVNEAKLKENTSKYFSELVRTNELCRSYSEACIELCREMGMKVVDLWTAFQRRDDWLTACFTDGVHLAAGGSKVVVEEILKVLKEAEWEPCLHWKSMPTEFSEDSPFDLVAYDGKTTINPSEWTYHREIQWD